MREDLSATNVKLDRYISISEKNSGDIELLETRVEKIENKLINPLTDFDRKAIELDVTFSINRTHEIVIIGLTHSLLKERQTTITEIAKFLGISSESWHVSYTRIIKARSNNKGILLIHFIAPSFRSSWLNAKKAKGDVKCNDIWTDQTGDLIFINQRQTFDERRALKEARKVTAELSYHSCWLSDGRIFCKKTVNGKVYPFDTSSLTLTNNTENTREPYPHNTPVAVDGDLPPNENTEIPMSP